MMGGGGAKVWFDAAELAALALPGLPRTKRKINELAAAGRWALKADSAGAPLARPRLGRGGGLQYHLSLLPPSATLELVRRGIATSAGDEANATVALASGRAGEGAQLWDWYDRQTQAVKDTAERRLRAVLMVERIAAQPGFTRTMAVAAAAADCGAKASTLWLWLGFVKGVQPSDYLPRLADRRVGGGVEAKIDEGAWRFFKSDYLRPPAPSLSSCYERLVREYAAPRGITVPHVKTFRRKLEREVDGRLIIAKRQGQDALRAVVPYQKRTVAYLHALECVNIDGHRWDVFVRWPDGTVARPMMVAIQDIYSRKFLAWRTGQTESALLTRLAFGDLFRKWGIPAGCLMDNGRAFASKWITGGSPTRFRFKIREDEPLGLLTSLGIENHWAKPYRGSSKPIERAFKDFCDAIAKHPAFAGAYTGNRPDAKPEDYGSAAVPLDVFLEVVKRGIVAHNQRSGRNTEMARGGSFDEAFNASYVRSPIRKANDEQMRLALLTADLVRADRKSGEIKLYGNRYWNEALYDAAGQLVTVRFDPDYLQQNETGDPAKVYVYRADGSFLAAAEVIAATGFLDAAAAKERAKLEANLKKKVRELEAAEQLLSAAQLVALMPEYRDDAGDDPEPTVIRPVRARGRAVGTAAQAQAAPARAPVIDRFVNAIAEEEAPAPRRRLTVLDGGLE